MPDPTYSKATIDGAERLLCVIPDSSKPEGICGWYSAALERADAMEGFTQHQRQMHDAEPQPMPDENEEDETAPTPVEEPSPAPTPQTEPEEEKQPV